MQGGVLILCNEAGCLVYNLKKYTLDENLKEWYINMLKYESDNGIQISNSQIIATGINPGIGLDPTL